MARILVIGGVIVERVDGSGTVSKLDV